MTDVALRKISSMSARLDKNVDDCLSEQFHVAICQPSPEIQAKFRGLHCLRRLERVFRCTRAIYTKMHASAE